MKIESDELVDAQIKNRFKNKLPSVRDGWRFDFSKHAKKKAAHSYILIAEETPGTIEGCLVYKIREIEGIYMAYIEIAPHNKGADKKYDLVAGCLIAYAGMLSYTLIEGHSKGWLTFDVMEEDSRDEARLMALYNKKYKAIGIKDSTTMYIQPVDTQLLIAKYLRI